MQSITRRELMAGLAALGIVRMPGIAYAANEGLTFDAPKPYSFDRLVDQQKRLAAAPYVPDPIRDADVLEQIDYDAFWKIKYKPEATLEVADGKAPVRFFHLGRYVQQPVNVHVIDGEESKRLEYDPNLFEMPADSPARKLPKDIGFAGFRVLAESSEADWLAFLGAAYFRSSGELNQYGLSARAVAVDVGLPKPEEFPRFTDYYIGPSSKEGYELVIACLFDSPSLTGVLEMNTGRHGPVVMDVRTRIFARTDIERVGIAPLTSMFWFSETDRARRVDWRPEIHDSDGLAMWTGAGERIWRPLNAPDRVITSSFSDTNPKGFGLLQRDRDFGHYEDDGVFYDKRPSLWVEPLGDWGKGQVQLMEIPTDDEIHDNIVAYWVNEDPVSKGDELTADYKLTWSKDEPFMPEVGVVTATRIGRGGITGQPRPEGVVKLVVDFDGGKIAALSREVDDVESVVTASRGTVSNVNAYSVKTNTSWRASFDLKVEGTEPVDLRLYLTRGGEILTETWLYQYLPLAEGNNTTATAAD